MIKKTLAILAIALVAIAVYAAFQPSEYRVQRSAVIAAPPAAVFPHVNELRKWEAWSPWAKRDPEMKQTYDGAPSGEGATSHWSGNSEVGEGRMTIVESRPDELVTIRLEFIKPFESTSSSQFDFQPEGAGTRVTWSMHGENEYIGKVLCLFMDMDAMIGADFEEGLAALKAVAEG